MEEVVSEAIGCGQGVPVVDTAGRVAFYAPSWRAVCHKLVSFEAVENMLLVTGAPTQEVLDRLRVDVLAAMRDGQFNRVVVVPDVAAVNSFAHRVLGDAVWAQRRCEGFRPRLVRLRGDLPAEGYAVFSVPPERVIVPIIPEGERQPLDALHRLAYTEAAAALHDGRCHDVLDVAKRWEEERARESESVENKPFTSFGNDCDFRAFVEASERQVLKETLRMLCTPAQFEFRPTAQAWPVMNMDWERKPVERKPVERPAPFTMPEGWTFGDLVAGRPRLTAEQWEALPLGAFFAHTGERCVYRKGVAMHRLVWSPDARISGGITSTLMLDAVKGKLVQVGDLPAVAEAPAVEPESTGWFASGKDADPVGVYGASELAGGWPCFED